MTLDNHIHLLMLGDSVFDNGVYVPGEPDVSAQVKSHLERSFKSSKLTFHARDGAVMSDVKNQQIKNIPEDITHIALSIGGNDLLGLIQYLDQNRGDSFHQNLQFLSQLKQKFSEEYTEVIQTIDTLGIPFSVCTIYYAGPIEESEAKRVDVKGDVGLSGTNVVVDAFDSAIIDVANKAQNCKEIIDLRWLFDDPGCYANPIEPSCIGGERIAKRLISNLKT